VIYGLIELGGGREKSAVGGLEAKVVKVGRNWGRSSLDEDVVLWAERFEDGDGQGEAGVNYLGGGEPDRSGSGLVI